MIPIPGFENYLVSPEGQVINSSTGRALKHSLNENGYLYASLWKGNKAAPRTVHRLVATAYIPNPDNKPIVNHIDANRANPHKDNLEWCTQSENIKHAYTIGNMSQRQHFSLEELDWILTKVLAGESMTHLAKSLNVGLSRLTINLRGRAIRSGKSNEFTHELAQQKKKRNTAANDSKRAPVLQLDMTGFTLASFPSATAAARALGKSSSGSIHNALNPNHPQQQAFGYQWKYA